MRQHCFNYGKTRGIAGIPAHLDIFDCNAEPPRQRIEAIRIIDMTESNSWAEFAALFRNTREGRKAHGPGPAQHVGHATMRLPDRSSGSASPRRQGSIVSSACVQFCSR
jgi:hypothetical protein